MKKCLGLYIHGIEDDSICEIIENYLVNFLDLLDPRFFYCAHVDSFDESTDMPGGSYTASFVIGEDRFDD